MDKAKLQNALFERFEARRVAITKKHIQFQQELAQDVHQFKQAYGDEALEALGDLSILAPLQQEGGKTSSEPVQAVPRQPRLKKRHRRQKSGGKPSARSQLEQHLPAAIETVAAKKDEFLARDIYQQLERIPSFDVTYKVLSAYLGKTFKSFGLTGEKRTEGEPIPRPTYFFRKKSVKGRAAKSNRKKTT